MCWPTFIGELHDTHAGKVGRQSDNMADLEEYAVLAFCWYAICPRNIDVIVMGSFLD